MSQTSRVFALILNFLSDELRRKGLKPKDHAKENMRIIHRLQQEKKLEKEMKEQPRTPEFKMAKFAAVPSILVQDLEKVHVSLCQYIVQVVLSLHVAARNNRNSERVFAAR